MNAPSLTSGRVVVVGHLVQRTDMSVGAADGDDGFCTDGLGRPTLFGTTIAGALFDTMRRCGHPPPPALSTMPTPTRHGGPMIESCLMTWNSHALAVQASMPEEVHRQRVAIRQDSGAAQPELLFSNAAVIAGTRWPLVLELDLFEWSQLPAGHVGHWSPGNAVAILRQALNEWVDGRCWLGSSVSRGLGWMRLEGLNLIHVGDRHALTWHASLSSHDAGLPSGPAEVLEHLLSPNVGGLDLSEYTPDLIGLPQSATASPWIYTRIRGTLDFGEPRTDGWGLDTLSHTASNLAAVNDHPSALAHTAAPDGDSGFFSRRQSSSDESRSGFAPDRTVALTPRLRTEGGQAQWEVEPFIAGSAIAGPIRHELSRRHRLNGLTVRDPVTGLTYTDHDGPPSDVAAWMGERFGAQDAQSSMLLVRDAYLSETHRDTWLKYQSEHHAEDEFRGSTFGGAKFTRELLARACFEWEIVLAAAPDRQATLDALEAELSMLLSGHQLAVGGAVWRGHGRGLWRIADCRRVVAGETWNSHEG